jgi:8-oxo-dGTP pyrophosphatase MutT (NUDIX family)
VAGSGDYHLAMTMTRGGPWFPGSWADRIRSQAAGDLTPAVPRRAATVLLLRDTPVGGPEVHMLLRRMSMAFAGGVYAYPGGGVDPRDERPVGWAGPPLAAWAERLGLDRPEQAQAVVCAAVRETFEEAGVLLAGPDGSSVVSDTTGDDWEADRRALVAKELSFADFLARRELLVRSDLLGPWARWTTPEFEERRYDTWFFLAALPAGQRTRDVSGEADHTVWTRPADSAAAFDRGEHLMMPPTIATLRALTPYGSVPDALAACAGRDMAAVLARLDVAGDEITVSWPGHPEFTQRIPRTATTPGSAAPGSTATRPGSTAPGSTAHPEGDR